MKRPAQVWAWIVAQPPIAFLLGGWLAFVLGCYPAYMSLDSSLQLYEVRSGEYSDAHATLATLIWRMFEWVMAGPFPMLLLQSGLLLFGTAAVLRAVISDRAAAVGAVAVLLYPPVFAVMAVIWPEPLMAGALVAGLGALLDPRRGWKLVGIALFVLACNCRFAAVAAIVPLLVLAPTALSRWRRVAAIVGLALAIEAVAIAADRALADDDTFVLQEAVMLPDAAMILRRQHVTAERSLEAAFTAVPLIDAHRLRQLTSSKRDIYDWWDLAHGESRSFDPISTSDEAWALFRVWRQQVVRHPIAYLRRRIAMSKRLTGWVDPADAIFDDLGDFDLLAPLHHRAIPSTWEVAMRAVAHAADTLRLFRVWLYLLGAIALVALVRIPLVRCVAASGLAWELSQCLFAGGIDYRYSHWLVTATCIAAITAALARRYAR
jgi:hypothetical protein